MLKNGNYKVYDRDDAKTEEEKIAIYRKAFECDYYLASVNAISEEGVIVNVDGNGNRVAAITWGPKHVVLVVGLNKVCRDVESAIKAGTMHGSTDKHGTLPTSIHLVRGTVSAMTASPPTVSAIMSPYNV